MLGIIVLTVIIHSDFEGCVNKLSIILPNVVERIIVNTNVIPLSVFFLNVAAPFEDVQIYQYFFYSFILPNLTSIIKIL